MLNADDFKIPKSIQTKKMKLIFKIVYIYLMDGVLLMNNFKILIKVKIT